MTVREGEVLRRSSNLFKLRSVGFRGRRLSIGCGLRIRLSLCFPGDEQISLKPMVKRPAPWLCSLKLGPELPDLFDRESIELHQIEAVRIEPLRNFGGGQVFGILVGVDSEGSERHQ